MPTIAQLATSLTTGAEWQSYFCKTTGPGTFGTRWADMSMGAGIPKYNAYVGSQNVATPLIGAGNDGIYRPASAKYIANVQVIPVSTSTSATWILADYLMHYPLTDGDSTDQQDMDNTLTLPRYSGGQVMFVATTPQTASALCTVGYTNDQGVSGRTVDVGIQSSTVVGCIINGHTTAANSLSPFIPLANGDKGVRSIEYITLQGGVGGFFAAVIVKPLTTLAQPEAVAVESSELIQKARMPEVLSGAYLNWIMCAGVSAAATPFRGHIQYAW